MAEQRINTTRWLSATWVITGWLLCTFCAGGCSPDIPDGVFACESDADCPAAFTCRDDRCVSGGAVSGDGDGDGDTGDGDGDGDTGDGDGDTGDGDGDTGDGDGDTGDGDGDTGDGDGDTGDGDGDTGDGDGDGDTGDGDASMPDAGGVDGGEGDPTCPTATHTCVAPVPGGWNGPVAVGAAGTAPACGAAYPNPEAFAPGTSPIAFGGLAPGSVSCSCSCGPAKGQQCLGGADLRYFTGSSCLLLGTVQRVASGCSTINPPAGVQRMSISGGVEVGSGACAPQSDHSFPYDWAEQVRACSGSPEPHPGTCQGDAACLPQPAAPFGAGLCIWRTGEAPCPADYPARTTYYTDAIDSRACSACSCEAPTGGSCAATATLYGSCPSGGPIICLPGGCGTTVQPRACTDVSSAQLKVADVTIGDLTPGSCTASDSNPSGGTLTPAGPVTICCP